MYIGLAGHLVDQKNNRSFYQVFDPGSKDIHININITFPKISDFRKHKTKWKKLLFYY